MHADSEYQSKATPQRQFHVGEWLSTAASCYHAEVLVPRESHKSQLRLPPVLRQSIGWTGLRSSRIQSDQTCSALSTVRDKRGIVSPCDSMKETRGETERPQ